MTEPRLVVFDLDGVLLSRDSAATYLTTRLRQAPWLAGPALLPGIAFGLSGGVPVLRSLASRAVMRAGLLSREPDAVAGDLEQLAVTMSRKHVVRDAVASLCAHVADGDEVLVNSASPYAFIRPFLDELGFNGVACIGSALGPAVGGTTMSLHNYHESKIKNAQAAGWAPPFDTVYTDSWSDAPLLRRATHPVLVNPSERTIRRAHGLTNLRVVAWS